MPRYCRRHDHHHKALVNPTVHATATASMTAASTAHAYRKSETPATIVRDTQQHCDTAVTIHAVKPALCTTGTTICDALPDPYGLLHHELVSLCWTLEGNFFRGTSLVPVSGLRSIAVGLNLSFT